MSEEMEITFPKMKERDYLLVLGAAVRQALIEIGYSPDEHIYDVDKDFLLRHQDKVAARFILRVREYFDGLTVLEQLSFLNDVLEYGRHYKFWWLEYLDSKQYNPWKNNFMVRAFHALKK